MLCCSSVGFVAYIDTLDCVSHGSKTTKWDRFSEMLGYHHRARIAILSRHLKHYTISSNKIHFNDALQTPLLVFYVITGYIQKSHGNHNNHTWVHVILCFGWVIFCSCAKYSNKDVKLNKNSDPRFFFSSHFAPRRAAKQMQSMSQHWIVQ